MVAIPEEQKQTSAPYLASNSYIHFMSAAQVRHSSGTEESFERVFRYPTKCGQLTWLVFPMLLAVSTKTLVKALRGASLRRADATPTGRMSPAIFMFHLLQKQWTTWDLMQWF